MPVKKKRVLKFIIIPIIILVPLMIAASVFYWVGACYRDDEKIYPNISISGVDVSMLTPSEAVEALNLQMFEERAGTAKITITFPDDSELIIKAEDINLTNDALHAVDDAFSIGRGRGFIRDTISFIQRYYGRMLYFDVYQIYDIEELNKLVDNFVEDFNKKFSKTLPYISGDEIKITKGAGQEMIDVPALKDIAYIGLFESFEAGHPVEIAFTLPETKINIQEILVLQQVLYKPAQSAILNTETLLVSNCVTGRELDVYDAVEILKGTESGKTATLRLNHVQPDVSREYLESLLFRDLFGECTTWVHGTEDRVTNVRISAEAVNGLVLKPGEEFSFNGIVGVRSTTKGYRPGGAFIDGASVTVIGGGICQTSSTIHSAIMDTQLLITEQKPHGRSVPYLPRGRDATVFWGKQDFKFVNNTEYPLRIDLDLDDRDLTARIYGTIIDDFPTHPLPIPAG